MNKTNFPLALPRFIAAGIAAILMLGAQITLAGSATWDLNPTSDWNTAANWTPNTVPNGPTNVATFGFSNTTAVSLSAITEVNRIVFSAAAPSYTITINPPLTLTISGAGITNNSGFNPSFVIDADGYGDPAEIHFLNNATAGASSFLNDWGGNIGYTRFFDNSTAGNSFFLNASNGTYGGRTEFYTTSTAGNGTFITSGSENGDSFAQDPYTTFVDSSTAGNATFITSGATSGYRGQYGINRFFDNSTAANATFTNNGGGFTYFYDNSTAGNAVIHSNGAPTGGYLGRVGGVTGFGGNSTAGNATLIAYPGAVSDADGGAISFFDDSTGETAHVEVFGNGRLDISHHNSPGVTVGFIEGDGNVYLGAMKLTVGSKNLSMNFPGLIQDGGSSGEPGGSLGKTGTGTFRLLGAGNTYTGGTVIDAGRLLANNSNGLGTGIGVVTVNNRHSVFGGTGRISGQMLTVETGAALMGGNAITASGALRVGNNVTLNSGAIIQLVLGPSGTHSRLTRTGGIWTFAPNQRFTFLDVGAQPGFYNNIITGLAGDPGGVASWTITNAGFAGTFSYDGAGNIDLDLTAANGPALQLTAAVSQKMHGALGPFNIHLPLTGEPGVECRSSGGDHTLRFTFSNNVVSGNATVTKGVGNVLGSPVFAGKNMTVNLTGVADVQKIIVTLSNMTDSLDQVLPDKTVSVNMLIGDTTGNKTVNASDIGQTKSQSGAPASATNFRQDVVVSGAINASDIGVVRSRSGASVP